MSILAAELARLSHLVSEEPIEKPEELLLHPEIKQQAENCRKLRIGESDIEQAILRGVARRIVR